jgi:hypothetical protein
MVYFKVDDLSDIESALQNIVEDIKLDRNNHLRLLCFHVPTADDEMIKQLEKKIFNCTIKRVMDYIYLEFK